MHYNVTQWYMRFPITCTTDLDCETKNPWLEGLEVDPSLFDGIWFFEYVDKVISYLT